MEIDQHYRAMIQDEVDNHGVTSEDQLEPAIRDTLLARRMEIVAAVSEPQALEFLAEGEVDDPESVVAHLVSGIKNDPEGTHARRIGEAVIRAVKEYERDWLQARVDEAVSTSADRQLRKQRDGDIDQQIHDRKWGVV